MMTAKELLALKAEREARRKAMEAVKIEADAITEVVEKAEEKIVEETIVEDEKVEEVQKVPKKGGKKKKATPTRSFMTVEEGEPIFVAPEAFDDAEQASDEIKED